MIFMDGPADAGQSAIGAWQLMYARRWKINTEEGGKVEEKSGSGRLDYTPDERIALQSSSFE
jgi:hypothetical protein